jgi:hypothetical protein
MRSRTTATCRRIAALVAAVPLACATAPPRPAVATAAPPPTVAVPPAAVAPSFANGHLRAGIVSVRVTGQEWNWRTPWEKQSPWTRTATGLVVAGHRILVASTAFGNHLLVEAQKLGRDARAVARATLVEQEGPLTLIEVDDPAFWEGLAALPLAEKVPTEGEVTILRWQRSGLLDSYPATVRQVRSGRHGLSQTSLLTLDVAASVDGLGESEVVVGGGRVLGLLTGRSGDVYGALAAPVLTQFLAGASDWRGFARAGLAWQDLSNPALREALGLPADEGGIRLTRVLPHGSGGGVLRPGDVLLEVGGAKLDPTGHFDHPLYGRMLFALLFSDGHRPGDTLEAKVLRDGRRLALALPLRRMRPEQDKVPPYVFGRGPEFQVVGGLVFEELARPYLNTWGDWSRRAPPRLLVALDREAAEPSEEAPRLVLLTSVLPDPVNLGYQDLRDLIVERVNDRPVGSMADLRAALASPQGGFHVVEFLAGQGAWRIVVDVAEARAATARIHAAYGVEQMGSAAP